MSLDAGSWSGKATCQVRLVDGKVVPLGTSWLEHGYGARGVTVPPGTRRIQNGFDRDRPRSTRKRNSFHPAP
jgi:hypothetical protein